MLADLGNYISGTILFEETLYDHASDGTPFVEVCRKQGIVPGIKTDKGLVPLTNSNNESWTQGLTDLAGRSAKYYEQVCPPPQPRPMAKHCHSKVEALEQQRRAMGLRCLVVVHCRVAVACRRASAPHVMSARSLEHAHSSPVARCC